MDTARSLTPNEVIEKAESRDFLMQCLRRTKLDPDLLEDVADACELQDPVLTSILLACGTLTPEETSNKLFLMLDEASLLLAQCKNECLRIGVDFGDGSLFDPSGDNSTVDLKASSVSSVSKSGQQSHPVNNIGADTDSKVDVPHVGIMPQAVSTGSHDRQTPRAAVKAASPASSPEALNDAFLPANPPFELLSSAGATSASPRAGSTTTAAATQSSASASATSKPRPRAQSARTPSPGSNSAASPSPASTYTRLLQQQQQQMHTAAATASGTSVRKTPRNQDKAIAVHTPSTSSFSVASSSIRSSVSKLPSRPASAAAASPSKSEYTPSYARPTAAHKSRMQGTEENGEGSPASSAEPPQRKFESRPAPPPPPPPPPPEPKLIKKPVFANISASLLRPTAAFLASLANTKEKKDEREARLGASQMLKASSKAFNTRATGSVRLNPHDLEGDKPLRASVNAPFAAAQSTFNPDMVPRPASSAAGGKKPGGKFGSWNPFRTPRSAPSSARGTRESLPSAPTPLPDSTAAVVVSCSQIGGGGNKSLTEMVASGDAHTPQSTSSRIPAVLTVGGTSASSGRSGIPKPPK